MLLTHYINIKRRKVLVLNVYETNNNLFTTLSFNKISTNVFFNNFRISHKLKFLRNKKQKKNYY